ncbi:MAG: desulfoferrodoxin [Clostridiales bacterium]|nr:desulfoferrodoxin [Clostridiales bacterium]
MELKYYVCEHCGKIIAVIKESGVPIMCCGQKMKELIPGTVDAAVEKHIPVFKIENGKVHVQIGEVKHPMLDEHYIEWIGLQTKQGYQIKPLKPGDEPKACFSVCDGDEVEAVYEHCNIHGLWKAE